MIFFSKVKFKKKEPMKLADIIKNLTPVEYRLKRLKTGELVLQELVGWNEGWNLRSERRDIPTVEERGGEMLEPYLYENETEYGIIGSAEAITALAEMMIAKARIGKNLIASFSDGTNKPIRIILDTDLVGDNNP